MTQEPDIIVIGAGSAGCAMAGRLADKGMRVLLIEAGKDDRHIRTRIPALTSAIVQNPDFDWCYRVEPDPSLGGRADIWPGGKRLGGGSTINGMMFIRGHRWDYDHWAELGAKGWDYASVLPYFRRMEDNERGADDWRGIGGPIAVSENRAHYPVIDEWMAAAQNAGIARSRDLNGEVAEGVDYVQVSQRAGMRCSSSVGYIHSRSDDRVQIMLESQVLAIETRSGRAGGVRLSRGGEEQTVRSRHGVVLSAGSMNTPRLLMLSGIGPADHLRSVGVDVVLNRPGVGRNLQDHVGTHLVNEVNVRTLNNDAHGLAGAVQLFKYAFRRSGALTTAIGHAQALVHGRSGLPAPNLQISFSAFAFDFDEQGRLMLRKKPSVSTLVGLMRPSYRGHITLRSSDPFAPPIIRHQQLSCDDDVEQIVEGLEIARNIMRQQPIARHVIEEVRPGAGMNSKEALREVVKLAAIPLYHPVGTAKIGAADDAMAVVDSDLRLHGIDGLWVADASVMPSLPACNTNATSIMIGDKGAEHVAATIRMPAMA